MFKISKFKEIIIIFSILVFSQIGFSAAAEKTNMLVSSYASMCGPVAEDIETCLFTIKAHLKKNGDSYEVLVSQSSLGIAATLSLLEKTRRVLEETPLTRPLINQVEYQKLEDIIKNTSDQSQGPSSPESTYNFLGIVSAFIFNQSPAVLAATIKVANELKIPVSELSDQRIKEQIDGWVKRPGDAFKRGDAGKAVCRVFRC